MNKVETSCLLINWRKWEIVKLKKILIVPLLQSIFISKYFLKDDCYTFLSLIIVIMKIMWLLLILIELSRLPPFSPISIVRKCQIEYQQ